MYSGAVCMLRFPCTVGLCACFVSHVQWGCVHASFPRPIGAVCMLHFLCLLGQCACFISNDGWASVDVLFAMLTRAESLIWQPCLWGVENVSAGSAGSSSATILYLRVRRSSNRCWRVRRSGFVGDPSRTRCFGPVVPDYEVRCIHWIHSDVSMACLR